MSAPKSTGFTLVELMMSTVILLALLGAVGGTIAAVNASVESQTYSAEVTTLARRNLQRISSFTRPAKLSTVMVKANAADVAAGNATYVGEWISPPDNTSREGVQFLAALGGTAYINAAKSTSVRYLSFEMDPAEVANGVDDDGDGLIDEGDVVLRHEGNTVAVVRNVEACTFAIDNRLLEVTLQIARRDSKHRLYRSRVAQAIYLRNN